MPSAVSFKDAIAQFGFKGFKMPIKSFKINNNTVYFRVGKAPKMQRDRIIMPRTEYNLYEYLFDDRHTIQTPIHSLEKAFDDNKHN